MDKYRQTVYEFLFYTNKKWDFDGQVRFFRGERIHYSDYMKAKRGAL